ncbi:MAG: hypothetical protein K0R31_668 [Clostridiales bacterium]|nr:hypothetical protein [Clostridiales bacterium]
MLILRILAFLFIVPGVVMVFASNWAVKKFNLTEKTVVEGEHEMDDEELSEYKRLKAVVNFKMLGLLVALPGFILIIIGFK